MKDGSLGELAAIFLRLGLTAFGGPAAHIALMKQEFVERRGWLSEAEFLDLLGAVSLIPGPNSTELAIHIGFLRGRWPGLIVAGACFILPAALLACGFAWAYIRFGTLPEVRGVLYAVKPVILAVVVQAIWGLVRPAVKSRFLGALGALALTLAFLGFDELAILFGAGAVSGIARWGARPSPDSPRPPVRSLACVVLVAAGMAGLPALLTFLGSGSAARAIPFGQAPLFLFFLKVGATLYGSGYVLLAFLRDGLVNRWHWLTTTQLLDATAVGQVTPGPVFTTATFLGYVLGGPVGALVATLGIFLPSFLFVAASGPLVPRLRKSALAGAFLDGVNVASLALMAAVTWDLGRAALIDAWTAGIALTGAVLLVRFRVNSAWLLAGAALLGLALSLLGQHGR